jgi:hypothetical protein
VGVEKVGAASGESVEVRGLRERMAAERSDRVVEIVDEDKEDVGFPRSGAFGGFGGEAEGDGGDAD